MAQTSSATEKMESPLLPFPNFSPSTNGLSSTTVAPLSLDNITTHAFGNGEYIDDRISQSSFDNGSFPSSRANSKENSPIAPDGDTFEQWGPNPGFAPSAGTEITVPDHRAPEMADFFANHDRIMKKLNKRGDTIPSSPVTASQMSRDSKSDDFAEIRDQLRALHIQSFERERELEHHKQQQADVLAKMKAEVATLKLHRATLESSHCTFNNDGERRLNFAFLRSCLLADHITAEDRVRATRVLGSLEYPDTFCGDRLVYRGPHLYDEERYLK